MADQVTIASQIRAARLAGFLFIVAMATGLFAEFYVHFPSTLIVPGDAAETAANLAHNERLYRVGIANNIITFVIDVVLIWALYVLLRPVNRNLALLAAFFRMAETTLACVAIKDYFVAMRYLADADRLRPLDAGQTEAMNILHYSYASTFIIVAIFLGLGSSIFNYLFYRSGYIPRALAIWGIFASAVLMLSQFTIVIFPELEDKIVPAAFGPIVLDEIALGFWLLFMKVRIPAPEYRIQP